MFNFSSNYGKAVVFSWLDDNKLIIGFSSGTISMVSTKSNALGQELASASIGNVAIESIAVNADLGKIAVASQGTIRFLQLADWQDYKALLDQRWQHYDCDNQQRVLCGLPNCYSQPIFIL